MIQKAANGTAKRGLLQHKRPCFTVHPQFWCMCRNKKAEVAVKVVYLC